MSSMSVQSTVSQGPRPVARRAPRPAPTGELRLTRRGRVVLLLVFLTILMGAVLALGGYSAATGTRGPVQQTRTVVVEEGDTLWAIASRIAAPGEVREAVHELEELNALPGPELTEGQRIAVPTR
jgi:LysM repeat protein